MILAVRGVLQHTWDITSVSAKPKSAASGRQSSLLSLQGRQEPSSGVGQMMEGRRKEPDKAVRQVSALGLRLTPAARKEKGGRGKESSRVWVLLFLLLCEEQRGHRAKLSAS